MLCKQLIDSMCKINLVLHVVATTESVQQQQQQTLTLWVGNLPDGTKAIDIKNMIGDAVKVMI